MASAPELYPPFLIFPFSGIEKGLKCFKSQAIRLLPFFAFALIFLMILPWGSWIVRSTLAPFSSFSRSRASQPGKGTLSFFLFSSFSTLLVGIAAITGGIIYSSVSEMVFFENAHFTQTITNHGRPSQSSKHYKTLQNITITKHYKRRAGLESPVSESTAFGAQECG